MFDRQKISPLYTDLYQLTMAQAYFMHQKADTPACFDYFFRKIPYNGGYMVFAGLQELLELIAGLKFEKDDIDFLPGGALEVKMSDVIIPLINKLQEKFPLIVATQDCPIDKNGFYEMINKINEKGVNVIDSSKIIYFL